MCISLLRACRLVLYGTQPLYTDDFVHNYNRTGQNSYYMWDRKLSGRTVKRFYCNCFNHKKVSKVTIIIADLRKEELRKILSFSVGNRYSLDMQWPLRTAKIEIKLSQNENGKTAILFSICNKNQPIREENRNATFSSQMSHTVNSDCKL